MREQTVAGSLLVFFHLALRSIPGDAAPGSVHVRKRPDRYVP